MSMKSKEKVRGREAGMNKQLMFSEATRAQTPLNRLCSSLCLPGQSWTDASIFQSIRITQPTSQDPGVPIAHSPTCSTS
jgi:hypothetical protein